MKNKTLYVQGGTKPYQTFSLPPNIVVPPPQTLSKGEWTFPQPCPPIIPVANTNEWWWQFAYWVVIGGKKGTQMGFGQLAPSVQVDLTDVITDALYYYSGGPIGEGPTSAAALR